MDAIERKMDEEGKDPKDHDAIPEITNGQWRTVSAVLATYRMMVDEYQVEQEMELAKLDYSKLTIEELHIIRKRYEEHPALQDGNGSNGHQELGP